MPDHALTDSGDGENAGRTEPVFTKPPWALPPTGPYKRQPSCPHLNGKARGASGGSRELNTAQRPSRQDSWGRNQSNRHGFLTRPGGQCGSQRPVTHGLRHYGVTASTSSSVKSKTYVLPAGRSASNPTTNRHSVLHTPGAADPGGAWRQMTL